MIPRVAELTKEIDTHFGEIGQVIQETRLHVLPLVDFFVGEDTNFAKVSGQFTIMKKDIKEIAKLVHEKIFELETMKSALEKQTKLFQTEETENLHGELEKDMEKHRGQTRLYELLCKYKGIFGPLPPPQNACMSIGANGRPIEGRMD